MVKMDTRVRQIKEQYVDEAFYFVINRGRQYRKTTTPVMLAEYLCTDYVVLHMDFQLMSSSSFESEERFVTAFLEDFGELIDNENGQMQRLNSKTVRELILIKDSRMVNMDKLFRSINIIALGISSRITKQG